MNKKITLLLCLCGLSLGYSQNVGINTKNPKQTLDVEGTVRLKKPGDYTENSQLLGISRSTGEVVTIDPNQGESFEIKTITFAHSPKTSEVGLRNIHKVNLKYPVNKYEVALLSARLTKQNGEAPMMKLHSIEGDRKYGKLGAAHHSNAGNGNRVTAVGLQYKNWLFGSSSVLSSSNEQHAVLQGNLDTKTALAPQSGDERFNMIFYGVPKYQIINEKGEWYFEGGFDYQDPFDNGNLKWTLELLPVVITVYEDKSFDFVVKTPPAAVQLLEAAKLKGGSGEPNRLKVGSISWDQVRTIGESKMADLNCFTVESAMKMVAGTARSMGITIKGGKKPE